MLRVRVQSGWNTWANRRSWLMQCLAMGKQGGWLFLCSMWFFMFDNGGKINTQFLLFFFLSSEASGPDSCVKQELQLDNDLQDKGEVKDLFQVLLLNWKSVGELITPLSQLCKIILVAKECMPESNYLKINLRFHDFLFRIIVPTMKHKI